MPASLQRWQGRWRSHPFLLLRHRWQRGLDDRSSSSAPNWCWKLIEAVEALRDCEGSDVGDIGGLLAPLVFVLVLEWVRGFDDLLDLPETEERAL